MNLTSPEPPPPAVLSFHSLQTFLREMDALVAIGRIDHDARNVILCALKRAIPMVERTGEDPRP
jgi:hypothetical protein